MIITVDIAEKMVEKRLEAFRGKPMPVFVDVRTLGTIDKESREYFASPSACQFITAGAILVKSPITALIANVFQAINRPPVTNRLFTDKEKALKWLENFKNSNTGKNRQGLKISDN